MFEGATLVDAGIDYIRVTSQEVHAQVKMYEQYRVIAEEDRTLGYEERNGGMFGFVGTKTRHAFFGQKKDWQMVQVSGSRARNALRMAREGSQATRIDVQVTYRVPEGQVGSTLREIYDSCVLQPHPGHRPPKVKLIEERYRPQTVYVGSRASDMFVRCYDKEEETGKEEYRNCLRVELEIKGRIAKAVWKHLTESSDGVGWLLTLMKQYVLGLGIVIPDVFKESFPEMVFKKDPTNEERQLAWLKQQVSGTVARLSALRGWIQPFSMLFETALTEWDKAAIMRTLTINYGH